MDIHSFFPKIADWFGLTVCTRQDRHGLFALVELAQVDHALQGGNGYLEQTTLSDAEQLYFRKFRYRCAVVSCIVL